MTREQKLEAALRAILSAGRDGCDRCRFQDWRCWAEAREVLATPPTSERDSVLSAAIAACNACRRGSRIDYNNGIDNCIDAIEQLKRKEK